MPSSAEGRIRSGRWAAHALLGASALAVAAWAVAIVAAGRIDSLSSRSAVLLEAWRGPLPDRLAALAVTALLAGPFLGLFVVAWEARRERPWLSLLGGGIAAVVVVGAVLAR